MGDTLTSQRLIRRPGSSAPASTAELDEALALRLQANTQGNTRESEEVRCLRDDVRKCVRRTELKEAKCSGTLVGTGIQDLDLKNPSGTGGDRMTSLTPE